MKKGRTELSKKEDLLSIWNGKTLNICNLRNHTTQSFSLPSVGIKSIFSNDSSQLLLSCDSGIQKRNLSLFDIETNQITQTFPARVGFITS